MKYILVLIISAISLLNISAFADTPKDNSVQITRQLAQLESATDGRLGVSAIDTANNTRIQYRADERFPFCSTFKVMVVAAILKQSMADKNLLQQKIIYTKKDAEALGYAPITKNHIA